MKGRRGGISSPGRDERNVDTGAAKNHGDVFFRPSRGFVLCGISPSHKWRGYFLPSQRDAGRLGEASLPNRSSLRDVVSNPDSHSEIAPYKEVVNQIPLQLPSKTIAGIHSQFKSIFQNSSLFGLTPLVSVLVSAGVHGPALARRTENKNSTFYRPSNGLINSNPFQWLERQRGA